MNQVVWQTYSGLMTYEATIQAMETYVSDIFQGQAREAIWLLEHPALYTLGTSAEMHDVLSHCLPVHKSGRGGKVTYHGPGQRIVYCLLDLRNRGQDIRAFIHFLQNWIMATLDHFGVTTHIIPQQIGVWTHHRQQVKKIAAIGVRVRKWITYHGFSVNICPDLRHYRNIVACGLPNSEFTSLKDMGIHITQTEFDTALKQAFTALTQT